MPFIESGLLLLLVEVTNGDTADAKTPDTPSKFMKRPQKKLLRVEEEEVSGYSAIDMRRGCTVGSPHSSGICRLPTTMDYLLCQTALTSASS